MSLASGKTPVTGWSSDVTRVPSVHIRAAVPLVVYVLSVPFLGLGGARSGGGTHRTDGTRRPETGIRRTTGEPTSGCPGTPHPRRGQVHRPLRQGKLVRRRYRSFFAGGAAQRGLELQLPQTGQAGNRRWTAAPDTVEPGGQGFFE